MSEGLSSKDGRGRTGFFSDAGWNLAGQALPLLAALFAFPVLAHDLGAERFGVLSLAWMFIGYFSLFDLGLGRALTKIVSEMLGAGRLAEVPVAIWTALSLMFGFGICGAALAIVVSPWLVEDILKVPASLRGETLLSFQLLAIATPVVIVTAGLRGVLEAHRRFKGINLIRAVLGVSGFVGPLFVLPFSRSLVPIVAVLIAFRVLAFLAHVGLCAGVAGRAGLFRFDRALMRPLFALGGWMSVSNVVGPLMVYLDRFLIGAMISMAAVAYYVTPYEVVTKLWLLPAAVSTVLFPAFAAHLAADRAQVLRLYGLGVKALLIAMFPLCLIIASFAFPGLRLWLGDEFAQHGAPVLRWLAAGVLINSLAQVPFALLQSAGRADLTAKLHLLELPLYLAALWFMVTRYGVSGAAAAWTARVALDTALLFRFAGDILPEIARATRLAVPVGALLIVLAFAIAGAFADPMFSLGFVIIVCGAFLAWAWHSLLEPGDRDYLRRAVRGRRSPVEGR